MHPALVRWSTRARAYAALAGAGASALTAWAYEKEGIGFASILGAALVATTTGAFLHFITFRIETTDVGLDIHGLLGKRRVSFRDIRRVELIAQWRTESGIARMATKNPADAYHIVIVARDRRINLNRTMDGIDGLIEVLQRRGAFTLGDEIMREAARSAAHPVRRGLAAAAQGGLFVKVALGAFMATSIVGIIAASSPTFAFTGQFFLDVALVAALLLGLFGGMVALARTIRASRFGDAPKEPPQSATNLLLTYVSALGGPLLVAGFLPRALAPDAKDRYVEVILLLAGAFLTYIPFKEFYAYAFRR